jgi:hypothetical protein
MPLPLDLTTQALQPLLYHWLEDGSYDEIKANILESDLDLFLELSLAPGTHVPVVNFLRALCGVPSMELMIEVISTHVPADPIGRRHEPEAKATPAQVP